MGIAFLPIDIDTKLPDEEKLLDYCARYKMIKNDNEGHSQWWNAIPVLTRAPEGTILDMENTTQIMADRYKPNLGPARYVNNIDKVFPEIPYMLNQLPFKEITVVALLEQTRYVDYHIDGIPGDDALSTAELSLEPRRYNILLTKHNYKSFFVADKIDGEKHYPSITKEHPCHVISDRLYPHGADYVGPGKVMLAIFGAILDIQKHDELIKRSYNKFQSNAIIYS